MVGSSPGSARSAAIAAGAPEQVLGARAVVRVDVELGQPRRDRLVEELPRVVAARFPQAARDVAEDGAVELPAPPVVAGELAQIAKERRDDFGHDASLK
jgi:hypothetical protein